MEKEQLNALAYIRVSSRRQVTDGNSLAVQRILVQRYAEMQGLRLRVKDIYVESAASARNDNRPKLQEMLARLNAGEAKASVLIIPKIDRLARNRDDYGDIKKAVKRSGLRVESCSETLEDTPVGRFTESMLASVAQFDNEIRAERSREGMIQAVTEGRWVWKAPLGYKNVRVKTGSKKGGLGTIAPDEPAATLMRQVFDRIASQKQSVREARGWLEQRGVKIAYSNIHHLLNNPAYCGIISAFGKEFEAKPPFVPLVSREQFALVQSLIKKKVSRAPVYDYDNPAYPLRGSLRCELCGSYFTASWAKGQGGRFPYYRCLKCPKMNLPRDSWERLFVSELALFRTDPPTMVKLKTAAAATYERKVAAEKARSESLRSDLIRLIELRRKVAIKTAEGIIPDDLGKEEMASLSAEVGRLESALKLTDAAPDEVIEALNFAETFFEHLATYWQRIEVKAQKKLQAFFFPEGIIAEKAGNLRTADYQLLELVKATFRGQHHSLVDQNDELPNEVISFILRLKQEFDVDLPILRESERIGKKRAA